MAAEGAAAAASSTPPAPSRAPAAQAAVDGVRELLGQRLRVRVPGGRIIEGDFQCLDPHGNLILGNAYEQLPTGAAETTTAPAEAAAAAAAAAGDASSSQQQQQQQANRPGERALGMVLVPKVQQEEVWVLAMPKQRDAIARMVEEAAAVVAAEGGRGGGSGGGGAA
jgi:small nuclear ribonucleoprotein (snRNP)-like protein